jgi:hypothetical protein
MIKKRHIKLNLNEAVEVVLVEDKRPKAPKPGKKLDFKEKKNYDKN